jgi:alpha(1,3/1,4) fucosyltransferase
MKNAYITTDGFQNNELFFGKYRDNYLFPYQYLRARFKKEGILLNTSDLAINNQTAIFNIHINTNSNVGDTPTYLLLWESPLILKGNKLSNLNPKYRKIFTWDDTIINGNSVVKLNIPNKYQQITVTNYYAKKFCCLISANKNVTRHTNHELYSERVKLIKWFEKNAPKDFDLFGIGWNLPATKPGFLGRFMRKLLSHTYPLFNRQPFPSYKGKVDSKNKTLSQYKFSICYENIANLDGYITEKIFDCFFAGCVPIYWGARNIEKYIPKTCFIDRRNFNSNDELYVFLKSINEEKYSSYEQAILEFIESDAAKPFYAEHFAETVVSTIMRDLQLAN